MPSSKSSAWRVEALFVLAAIAVLGLLVAPLPFTGDQALFAAGARQLSNGSVLYRDFWDVKQPGIYAFYVIGGKTFGYSEVGLHLFELAYQLVFATVLIVTLRNAFRHRWIGPLVALLVFGTYYTTIEPLELGQVESLVGLPMYLCLWASLRALGGIGFGAIDDAATGARRKRKQYRIMWLAASGLMGGVVIVFKLVLAPIVGGFWLITAWELARSTPTRRVRAVASGLGVIAAGLAVPLVVTVAYLAANHQLGDARWTYFTVSPQTTGIAGRPLSRLTDGAFHIITRWALPLALGIVGIVAAVRRGWDRLQVRLVAWIALGIPVFLIQHWWIYTYMSFLVPVGIFAAYGLDVVASEWHRVQRVTQVAVVLLALVLLMPAGIRFAKNSRDVQQHGFALSAAHRAQLRLDLEPDYGPAALWAAWLRQPKVPAGGVYVLGNPLDLYLSDRTQTVAINGWSPEQYPPEVWAKVRDQIRAAKPVEVVVDRFSDSIMRDRSPETRRLIASRYQEVGHAGPDRWYQLRTAKSGSG